MRDLEARLERVEKFGSSGLQRQSAMDIIRHNRAGSGDRRMMKKEIIEWFCVKRQDPDY